MKKRALALLTAMSVAVVAACESGYWLHWTSEERAPCDGGRCIPAPPPGWQGPVLFWAGAPEDTPACPPSAPEQVYEGYVDIFDEPRCPTCTCGPAACQFEPVGLSDSPFCSPGAPEVLYPVPEGWNGECISTAIIPDDMADSVHFRPNTLRPCSPEENPDPVGWTIDVRQIAVACGTAGVMSGCDSTQVCAPGAASPPGFLSCVTSPGDRACPSGYPDRHVVFDRIDTTAAGCTPCACQDPQGGECTFFVAVHGGTACDGLTLGTASVLNSEGCGGPLVPGVSVASTNGYWSVKEPGFCEPVPSVPTGAPVLASPTTFCCTE